MLSNVLYVVRIVVLGLWVGAMAGFAFLFAPIAFAHIGPTAAFAATIAASVRAITAMGAVAGIIAGLLTVGIRFETLRRKITIVLCIAIAIAFGAIETQAIVPKMEATPLMTAAYDALHRQSSGVYSAVLIFALLALVLSVRSERAYMSR
ncbi:MAG: hypothetical protein JO322_04485 [Candidatus Eremiobacteraeota bacterium]|nr:hypothetical protein [Candidatus Eremiobacteraeota bacterium]